MDTFMKSRLPDINDNWTWFPMNTYLLLEDNKNIAAVEQQLKLVPQYQERSATNDQYILSAEALNGFHFSNPKHGDLGAKGARLVGTRAPGTDEEIRHQAVAYDHRGDFRQSK